MRASVWLLEPVVRDRQDRIHREAAGCRRPAGRRVVPGRRPGSGRERLGWTLVEIGLRLALPGGHRPVPATQAAMGGGGR